MYTWKYPWPLDLIARSWYSQVSETLLVGGNKISNGMSVDTCFKNFKTITTAIHNKNPECSGNIVEILLHEVQLPLRRDCMTSMTTCMTSVKLMESFISTKMPLTVPIPPSSTTTRHFHQGKVPYSWRWWSAVPLWMPKQTSIMTVLCMLSHHWAYPMPPRTILCRVWKPPFHQPQFGLQSQGTWKR